MTASVIVKKSDGERLTERCFLWRNIAAKWKVKKPTTFVIDFSEGDDAFVTDIPLGLSDLQTTKKPGKCKCLIQ